MFVPSNIILCEHKFAMEVVMNYMTASQIALKWGVSQRRVQILCAEGRIEGAFKLGEAWAIPADIQKPADKRYKSEDDNE